ncbi:unnamed protein product [Prunus brigantina]
MRQMQGNKEMQGKMILEEIESFACVLGAILWNRDELVGKTRTKPADAELDEGDKAFL